MTRTASIILLLFNGFSACYGGLGLIIDPSGKSLGMSVEALQHSPFSNYTVPGWILFIILGIGSIVAGVVVLLKSKGYPFLTIFIGFALAIWISVQMLMMKEVFTIHIIYGIMGILIILLGMVLRKKEYS